MFRKAIEELPGQESPGIFGMHPNADLTFRSLQVQPWCIRYSRSVPRLPCEYTHIKFL